VALPNSPRNNSWQAEPEPRTSRPLAKTRARFVERERSAWTTPGAALFHQFVQIIDHSRVPDDHIAETNRFPRKRSPKKTKPKSFAA